MEPIGPLEDDPNLTDKSSRATQPARMLPCDQQAATPLPPREDVVNTDHWREVVEIEEDLATQAPEGATLMVFHRGADVRHSRGAAAVRAPGAQPTRALDLQRSRASCLTHRDRPRDLPLPDHTDHRPHHRGSTTAATTQEHHLDHSRQPPRRLAHHHQRTRTRYPTQRRPRHHLPRMAHRRLTTNRSITSDQPLPRPAQPTLQPPSPRRKTTHDPALISFLTTEGSQRTAVTLPRTVTRRP